MDEQQKNPDKIPMHPVETGEVKKNLYEMPEGHINKGHKELVSRLYPSPKEQPGISPKYRFVLALLVLSIVIVAVLVGKVLFRNGLR